MDVWSLRYDGEGGLELCIYFLGSGKDRTGLRVDALQSSFSPGNEHNCVTKETTVLYLVVPRPCDNRPTPTLTHAACVNQKAQHTIIPTQELLHHDSQSLQLQTTVFPSPLPISSHK